MVGAAPDEGFAAIGGELKGLPQPLGAIRLHGGAAGGVSVHGAVKHHVGLEVRQELARRRVVVQRPMVLSHVAIAVHR